MPLILITNDDGYTADGIQALATRISSWAEVIVVAPSAPRSGAGCSITCTVPVTLQPVETEAPFKIWACSGTPVDCVKLALERVVPRKPDLVLSGINHGDNASVSLLYSGTMGAVFEACMKGIPALGVSQYLKRGQQYAEHAPTLKTLQAFSELCKKVVGGGLPTYTCLDINFPLDADFKGWKVCRQGKGVWSAEWNAIAPDPAAPNVQRFMLTGDFTDLEPESSDTDMHALANGFCSIVPLHIDLTAHQHLAQIEELIQ